MIRFQKVGKEFHAKVQPRLLREHLSERFRSQSTQVIPALRDVTFKLDGGQSLGVVGSNGAGKSTLLSLVVGLTQPTSGKISINGRISAILELGSGFHPDLTGRENVLLNASLLGMTRAQALERMDSIVEFADIGEFIGSPLRIYSAGMTMRLAFSVAVHVDPDILVIDEVLAVGDQQFAEKCYKKILDFRRQGKTMVVASHSEHTLRQLCDHAIWLNRGEMMAFGKVDSVLDAYFSAVRS